MDSIGPYKFIALHGSPQPAMQQLTLLCRPGVDGVAIWLAENRGVEFTLHSVVDCADIQDAEDTLYNYTQLLPADPQSLVWAGVSYDSYGFFKVMRVTNPKVTPILGSAGGVYNDDPGAKLEADWTLICIPN